MNTSCTVFGLLHVFSSDESVYDRYLSVRVELGESLGSTGADIVEMRCIASDDAADSDDSIYLFGTCHLGCSVNEFETSRDSTYVNIVKMSSMFLEGLNSSV